ncbi:hypothetical protein THRCLA_10060 [Thraustotheca clavata]|uniref:Secreted protein n=1 Tax=Thraustotheca clavata TaxID=74557 RepID=A0A1V9YTE7_9STRA|nr:hypothetical protein THRCLA_10060 [Thraustotheca clavata]
MKSVLFGLVSVFVASVSAAAVDCSTMQFVPFLPQALNPFGPMIKCSRDIKENPFKMLSPSWIPESSAMVTKFSQSSNCKNFYNAIAAYMKTIKPPCIAQYVNGAPLTTDIIAAIPFELACMTWQSLYASGAIHPPECSALDFAPLAPVLVNPFGPLVKCSFDIHENPAKMLNPSWVPKNLAMVNAFANSDNCFEFYAVLIGFMGKIESPCVVSYVNGVPITTDVASKIPFDMAIATWRSFYTQKESSPSLRYL